MKSQLTYLTNYVKDRTDLEIPNLDVRKQKLKECYTNFCKVPGEIDKLDEASDCEETKAEFQVASFDGNFVEWQGFYNTFWSLVHENDAVPIVHILHLHKSYLIGSVVSVTNTLSASEDIYFVAWELIQKPFNKPRKIDQGHIRALYELTQPYLSLPSFLR